MKLHHKIIYIPVFVMLMIFIFSSLGIEYYLKSALQKRFERELQVLSSFSLAALEVVKDRQRHNSTDEQLGLIANKIAKASSAHISYFSQRGKLLADSDMNFDEITNAPSYIHHPEIIDAITNTTGVAKRYDDELNQDILYVATYDNKTNLVARVSLPTDSNKSTIVNLRWTFVVILLAITMVIVALGIMSIRLINRAVQKEKNLQELRVVARTREITLIQTMSTMLNGSSTMDDASRVLMNIIPRLLPSLSGAIFLNTNEGGEIKELTHWGEQWPTDVALLATQCWRERCNDAKVNTVCNKRECQLPDNVLCVSLVGDNQLIGFMHLVSHNVVMEEKYKNIAQSLAEQISYGLSNLRLKDKLRNQAIRDPLTNLYNRRFMFEAFEQVLNRAERHSGNLAVLMIDLDFFKQFNDTYGHEAGDRVLIEVAEQFKNNLRLEDIACRYGGEEFCIICPDASLRAAFQLAEKLKECIGELNISYRSQDLDKITISTGIAIFPNHGVSTIELINQADKALYEAKNNGRNCTHVSKTNGTIPKLRS